LANFASPIWNETKGGNVTFLQPLEVDEEFEYLAKKHLHDIVEAYIKNIHTYMG
jgi:hypothetical protein